MREKLAGSLDLKGGVHTLPGDQLQVPYGSVLVSVLF